MTYRTWKDGINDQLVCVFCKCPQTAFDHAICRSIVTSHGYFGPLFVPVDQAK